MKHEQYQSYLVRFWLEDIGEGSDRSWHGEIESIQIGQKWQFNDLKEMELILQNQLQIHSPVNVKQNEDPREIPTQKEIET